jgi:hypothetical protein
MFFHLLNIMVKPLVPFFHGIIRKQESAYWINTAGNVIFRIIFAVALIKESKISHTKKPQV